jgi:hypothetical protein
MPKRVIDVLFGWVCKPRSSTVWNAANLGLMWIIWRERNNLYFQQHGDLHYSIEVSVLEIIV